jgi:hypothetical protein
MFCQNALAIQFKTPQYSIVERRDPKTGIATYSVEKGFNTTCPVYQILIPLAPEQTKNKFQKQTWYFFDQNPLTNYIINTIPYKIETYGNYSKLWEYINELNIQL